MKIRGIPILMEVLISRSNSREVALVIHTTDKVTKHTVGLISPTGQLGNISNACRVIVLIRDMFYRSQNAAIT